MESKKTAIPVKIITVTAMFTAMNIILSSFGVPVPGGHLYLCDIVICTAALLLDPLPAFVAGGIGSFLGDLFFYPAPMFVSLVTHGLQAFVISYISHKRGGYPEIKRSVIALSIGAMIMIVGYSFGRAYIYSTPEYAVIKLPYEILQAALGAVVAMILVFRLRIARLYHRLVRV